MCRAAVIVVIRFSPHANRTYNEEADSIPRWLLVVPAFLLALAFNRVRMIVEVRADQVLAGNTGHHLETPSIVS